jgi:hypothetical protein
MRLAPRSLFGRLMLVLLTVLVAAQLLSFAIHMLERGEELQQASGMQSAQRIADIVKLLDSLDTAERRRIVPVLSTPALAVALEQRPVPPRQEESSARSALFAAMLRRFLGDPPSRCACHQAVWSRAGRGFIRRHRLGAADGGGAYFSQPGFVPRFHCGTARW